jgi:phospholipase/lecithinase/hemolysin
MPHLVALLGAALLAATPAALAQTQAPRTQAPQNQAPMPAPSQPAPQISDQKLDAAAAATMQVASLSRQYREQLSAAPPNEKQRIVDEANTKIEKAITDQGLSLQEYNSIMEEARANPEVHQKILDRLPKTGN